MVESIKKKRGCDVLLTAVLLVTFILTIWGSVTVVPLRNTLADLFTGPFTIGAHQGGTILLIWSIVTVFLAVTDLSVVDTPLVTTLEVVHITCVRSYNKGNNCQSSTCILPVKIMSLIQIQYKFLDGLDYS